MTFVNNVKNSVVLVRVCISIGLLLSILQSGLAQHQATSMLIDEFTDPNCEDLWARLDNLSVQIRANPSAVATVEISGKTNDIRANLYWESMIRTYLIKRKFPSERWRLIRTPLQVHRRFRFSLTPPRAPLPDTDDADWPIEYAPGKEPFIFTSGDSYAVEINVCLYVDEIALLEKVVAANPRSRLNVVLIVKSERQFRRRKRDTLAMLSEDYAIPLTRIKVFKKISRKPNPYGIEPNTEYWLLP